MLFSHLHPRILLPPYGFLVFLDFRNLQQQLKTGGGLGFPTLSLFFTFQSSIVLSLITLYLNINTSKSLPQQQLEMHREEKNLTENNITLYLPYGFRNPYKTINQLWRDVNTLTAELLLCISG
jgi:hypothetical protein